MNTAAPPQRNAREPWTAAHIPDQRGRTVLVTGANCGLGLLTSLELARRGAHVIMAVRDMEKGRAAADRYGRCSRARAPRSASSTWPTWIR